MRAYNSGRLTEEYERLPGYMRGTRETDGAGSPDWYPILEFVHVGKLQLAGSNVPRSSITFRRSRKHGGVTISVMRAGALAARFALDAGTARMLELFLRTTDPAYVSPRAERE